MQDFIRRHPNLLALAVLSLIAYANALPNSFQFDDYVTIVENRPIQDLRKFPSYFTDPRIFSGAKIDWRPVLQVTYAVDYAIGGANPTPNLALFHSGGSVRVHTANSEMVTFASRAFLPPDLAGSGNGN